MYDLAKIKEAQSYLKTNNISGKSASSIALQNKFGMDYNTLVKQLQAGQNTVKAQTGNNPPSPVPAAAPTPAPQNVAKAPEKNIMQTKSLDDAGKKNLDSQLNAMGYDTPEKKQEYYTQNKIQYAPTSALSPTAAAPVGQKPTEIKQEAQKYTPATSLQDWMNRGKKPTELVDYVEGKYGITAEYDAKTNKVVGYDANGNQTKEWTFDASGNPVRKDISVMTKDTYLQNLQGMMDSGASEKAIEKYLLDNKDLSLGNRDQVREMYRTYLSTKKYSDSARKLSTLDGKGLYSAYKDGKFVPGDGTWNMLTPEVQAKFNDYRSKNIRLDIRNGNEVVANLTSTESIDEVYNAMQVKNPEYQKKYQEIVLNDPQRTALREDLSLKYAAIKEKQAEYKAIEEKMKTKYPSSSDAFIASMIKKERGSLMTGIESLIDQYDVVGQEYNMLDADLGNLYTAYTKDAELDYNLYQTAMSQYLQNVQNSEVKEKTAEQEQFIKDNQKFAMLRTTEAYNKYTEFNSKVVSGEIEGEYISNEGGLFFQEKSGKSHQIVSGELYSETSAANYQIKEYQNADGTITATIFNPETKEWDVVSKDIAGNIVYPNSGGSSGSGGSSFGGSFGSDGGVDLRYLRQQYPNEAWAGTNNPTGMTWGATSAGLKEAWAEAGITFRQGSARPGIEGGNYVEFDSIQDGLAAYAVALHRRESSVRDGLASWVGYCKDDVCLAKRPTYTKANAYNYADSIISESGVTGAAKFNTLNMQEIYKIQKSQLKRESPGLYAVLNKNGWVGDSKWQIPFDDGGVGGNGSDVKSGSSALSGVILDPKATEAEHKSYMYGVRMADSQHLLVSLEQKFMDKGLAERYWETYAPNAAKSEEQQLFETNGKEFVAALLRKDTGAAVTPDEWAYYNGIYFPQPGDKDATIRLKQQKREIAIKGILQTAGGDTKGNSVASYYTSATLQGNDTSFSAGNQKLIMDNIVKDVMSGAKKENTSSLNINDLQYTNPELSSMLKKLEADNRNKAENTPLIPKSPYNYGTGAGGNPTWGAGSLPGQ